MAKNRFSPEQIVAKLRQIEDLMAAGKALVLACKEAGITDVTYYRPINPRLRAAHLIPVNTVVSATCHFLNSVGDFRSLP